MKFSATDDYILKADLGQSDHMHLWLAEQKSIARKVVLVQLTELTQRKAFLEDARAKAAVDHPLIASIYEAHDLADSCFFAREYLLGENLQQYIKHGDTLIPSRLAHILSQTAKAAQYYEERNISTSPLHASHIFLDDQGIIRFSNLATSHHVEKNDIHTLGNTLTPLVKKEAPGTSRMLNLLYWMSGNDPEKNLSWSDVLHYASLIETQLTPSVQLSTSAPVIVQQKKSMTPLLLKALILTVPLLVIFIYAPKLIEKNAQRKQQQAELKKILQPKPPLEIAENPALHTKAFWITQQPVSIEEYQYFLSQLDLLESDKRALFNHSEQPTSKQDHKPHDWENMLAAAHNNTVYEGEKINLRSPIRNVDWWDAYAYAKLNDAKMPNAEEWQAALTSKSFPSLSYSEWCGTQRINPSNPVDGMHWLIIQNQKIEYTDDRSLYRKDLTFRVRYDSKP